MTLINIKEGFISRRKVIRAGGTNARFGCPPRGVGFFRRLTADEEAVETVEVRLQK